MTEAPAPLAAAPPAPPAPPGQPAAASADARTLGQSYAGAASRPAPRPAAARSHAVNSTGTNNSGQSSRLQPANKDNIIIGSGTQTGSLRAAHRQKAVSPEGGLFVSKLKAGTLFQDLKDHIFRFTGLRLRCIPIRSRNEHLYASFRVLCNAGELRRLLDSSLWPKGSLVCEFRSKQ